ncbi:MAG: enoyl-CoA hydratase-related protein [Bacillota bacterium]
MSTETGQRFVTYKIEDRIAVVTVNRPPVNALNAQVISELNETVDVLEHNSEVGVVIITGASEKAFVAGADITQFPALREDTGTALAARGQYVFDRIEALEVPVICAVNGFALGGGNELAMACDIRVAAENAIFGQPEVNLGLIPGYGGTQRLPRLVGMGKAMEMVLTGDGINAEEAFRIGLVDKLVPKGAALEEAVKMAQKILTKGPIAIKLAKKAVYEGMEMSLKEGLAFEARNFGKCCETEDKNEGANAFLEKRKPNFQGK